MLLRYVLALLFIVVSVAPALAQRQCDRVVTFQHTHATTSPVELVPGVDNQRIYFCGFSIIQRGPSLDFQVVLGAGINCTEDRINATPIFELPSDVQFSTRIETVGMAAATGRALCIHTPGNGTLAGALYYAQF